MSTSLTVNGVAETVPVNGEGDWGTTLSTYLLALRGMIVGLLTFGNSAGPGTAATTYLKPGYVDVASNATEISVPVPAAGKVKRLYIACTSAPTGVGGVVTYTVRKNGVDTGMTCTIATGATAGNAVNAPFSVVAGDLISIKASSNGSIASGGANVVAALAITSG